MTKNEIKVLDIATVKVPKYPIEVHTNPTDTSKVDQERTSMKFHPKVISQWFFFFTFSSATPGKHLWAPTIGAMVSDELWQAPVNSNMWQR